MSWSTMSSSCSSPFPPGVLLLLLLLCLVPSTDPSPISRLTRNSSRTAHPHAHVSVPPTSPTTTTTTTTTATPTTTTAAGPPPTPTAAQLRWLSFDIGFLIHYNMASYLSNDYDGCNRVPHLVPDIHLFDPQHLDTDNWVQSMLDAGAGYAVLVAKHNCGFATWPTQVRFPLTTGQIIPYNYSIAYSPVAGTDLVGNFVASCHKAGIHTGFYYSVVWNNWLNVQNSQVQPNPQSGQMSISQDTYNTLIIQMLQELWSQYGELLEIWFDGGYSAAVQQRITQLLQQYQPNASVFNGLGATNNTISNIGNEIGWAPADTWSTIDASGSEDPDGPIFSPAECPTTLQISDRWFIGSDFQIRPLHELIDVYHNTVGRNCKLLLDLGVDRDGVVDPMHAQRYKELGNYIRTCYGTPLNTQFTCSSDASNCIITFNRTVLTDRVVIREDLTLQGPSIRAWYIDALMQWGDCMNCWIQINPAQGQSIGNKRIALFAEAFLLTAIRLNIQKTATGKVALSQFSAYLCQDEYN